MVKRSLLTLLIGYVSHRTQMNIGIGIAATPSDMADTLLKMM